jgi:hypothetical protein
LLGRTFDDRRASADAKRRQSYRCENPQFQRLSPAPIARTGSTARVSRK